MGWLDDILNRVTLGSTQELVQDPSATRVDPTRPQPQDSLFSTRNIWSTFRKEEERQKIEWGSYAPPTHPVFKEAQKLLESAAPLARLGGKDKPPFIADFKESADPNAPHYTPLRRFWDPDKGTVLVPPGAGKKYDGLYDPNTDTTVVNKSSTEKDTNTFHENVHRGFAKIKPMLKDQYNINLSHSDEEAFTRWIEHTFGPPDSVNRRVKGFLTSKQTSADYDAPYKDFRTRYDPYKLLELANAAVTKLEMGDKLYNRYLVETSK